MTLQPKTQRKSVNSIFMFSSRGNRIVKGLNISLFLLLFILQSKAQKPLELTAGVGLPEIIHVGLRYNMDKTKLGFTLGGVPSGSSSIFTLGADVYSHFGRNAEQMDGSTWFVNFGINHLKENSEYAIEKWLFLKGRIGRAFYLSPVASIDLALGLMYEISHSQKDKTPQQCSWFCFDFSDTQKVIPSLSLNFNVKI